MTDRDFAVARNRPFSCSLVVLGLASLASSQAAAQDDTGAEATGRFEAVADHQEAPEEPVAVAIFMFADEDSDIRVATEVMAGFRRGARAHDDLAYVDPTAALNIEADQDTSAVDHANDLLEQAYRSTGPRGWRQAIELLEEVLDTYRNNLGLARRRNLVDAMMLMGAAQCMARRRRACRRAFSEVLTFREAVEYDLSRLPEQPMSTFQEIRDEVLSGQRGSIRITSSPPGAEVFVDGRFVGAAPTRAEGLLVGDHYVTLKMAGYPRRVVRASVETDFEQPVEAELEQLESARLLRDALRAVRNEMGDPRMGPGMRDLRSLLGADQLVLGRLTRQREGADDFDLNLHIYDLRTGHSMRTMRRPISWEAAQLDVAEELLGVLYEGVDLSGRIRPAEEQPPPPPPTRRPFYRTWWFWTIAGVVVAGGAVGVGVWLGRPQLPDGVIPGVTSF